MTDKNYILENPDTGEKFFLKKDLGSIGPSVLDVTSIYSKQGIFTFDPGFAATASCKSDITYIDGENGILMYRGYPIEVLAKSSSFLEVCFLLLNGELPNQDELNNYEKLISDNSNLDKTVLNTLKGFKNDAHPMSILSAMLNSMAAFYHDSIDINKEDQRNTFNTNIISQVPTAAAAAFRHITNKSFLGPDKSLGYCENILKMFFGEKDSEFKFDPISSEALNLLLILHADHEQNCSTSTVRMSGSSGVNPYAAISAGVTALWGPAHGGANEAVINMLDEIGSIDEIDTYVDKAKDKNDPFRLMGFGHRVYKNFDPRAKIIKKAADKVLDELGIKDPVLDIAKRLEDEALNDSYFIDRKLYPNVDFYSGIIYRALGIPTEMFTVMFALGRIPGWIAQWLEMRKNMEPIGRPRQIYTGLNKRSIS